VEFAAPAYAPYRGTGGAKLGDESSKPEFILCEMRLAAADESRRFRKKNRPRVMMTAKNSNEPITVPAIAAMETLSFWGVAEEARVGAEVPEEDTDDVDVEVLVLAVAVAEGALLVVEGERPVKQLLSSEEPTITISELPPVRPSASNMKNTIDVPRATLDSQVKEACPTGGVRITISPPGMTP